MSTVVPSLSGIIPAPSIEVLVSVLTTQTVTVTVTRSWSGQAVVVRGALRTQKTGAQMVFQDYGAPLGVPVRYIVDEYDVAGSLIVTGTSATLTLAGGSRPWVSDPLDPANAVQVTPGPGAFLVADRPANGAAVSRLGGAARIGAFDVRQEGTGIPVSFLFQSRAELAALERVLVQADPFLVRLPPDRAPRDLLHLHLPVWRREFNRLAGGLCIGYVTGTAEEVAPPAASVVIPTRPYGSIAQGQTYGALRTQYATYLAMQRGS